MSLPMDPRGSNPTTATPIYYKLDASRVSLREFWWETKLFVWVGLIIKLFRLRIRASTDDLAVESLRPFEVNQARIAPATLARYADVAETPVPRLRDDGDGNPAFVPVSPAPQAPPDLMEIARLDELRRLQNRQVNWRSTEWWRSWCTPAIHSAAR